MIKVLTLTCLQWEHLQTNTNRFMEHEGQNPLAKCNYYYKFMLFFIKIILGWSIFMSETTHHCTKRLKFHMWLNYMLCYVIKSMKKLNNYIGIKDTVSQQFPLVVEVCLVFVHIQLCESCVCLITVYVKLNSVVRVCAKFVPILIFQSRCCRCINFKFPSMFS